jgi:hypothetical protein
MTSYGGLHLSYGDFLRLVAGRGYPTRRGAGFGPSAATIQATKNAASLR